jgi:hypothetical protein
LQFVCILFIFKFPIFYYYLDAGYKMMGSSKENSKGPQDKKGQKDGDQQANNAKGNDTKK